MERAREIAPIWMLLCCGLAAFWGFSIGLASPKGLADYKGLYYAARSLIQHCDPYKLGEPLRIYQREGGSHSQPSDDVRTVLTRYVYFPPAFVLTAPLALLPPGPAQLLWMVLTAGCLILAAILIWDLARDDSLYISLFLICFVLANSEILFATCNVAGIVVSLCVVAVWCFIEERFMPIGVLCLAVSLAVKPHDAGLVWLVFLVAGGVYRKRALQTIAVNAALAVPTIFWVTHIAPHWMQELHSNLLVDLSPGGACDPGLSFSSGNGPSAILDLQSTISVFWDDPRIYNSTSYLVCGALLLFGSLRVRRSGLTRDSARLALGFVVPLTILMTYHQYVDAKLLMLAVPACAMLWAEGGLTRWFALLITTASIVSTGDITLTALQILTSILQVSTAGLSGKLLAVVLTRPAPLILLTMAIFYLWAFIRRAPDLERPVGPKRSGQESLVSVPAHIEVVS
jgi:hypothetical protein